MARFKIEEIEEIEMESKVLESELEPQLKVKESMSKKLGLNYELTL